MRIRHLLLLLTSCLIAIFASAADYRAYKIVPGNGLNSNIVRDIIQDGRGYLWLASIHGLYRYDGYTMKQVITKEDLSSGLIPDLRTVNTHRWGHRFLWTRLRGDFYCCYDLHRNQFVRYADEGLQNTPFTRGFFGNPDEAWLYGNQNGCRRITFDGKEFQVTDYKAKAGTALSSGHINFINQGAKGRIWIGTDQGLVLSHNGQLKAVGPKGIDVSHLVMLAGIEYFVCEDGKVLSYQKGRLRMMCDDTSSIVGVNGATAYADGLLITTNGDTYEYHTADHSLQRSTVAASSRYQMEHDSKGNALLWSPEGEYVIYVRAKDGKVFTINLPDADNIVPIQNPRMLTTPQGEVVISTFGRGLYFYKPEQDKIVHHTQRWGSDAFINTNYLLALYQDNLGNIWISQEDLGLSCLRPILNKADYLQLPGTDFNDFHDNQVRMLRQMADGTLYAASFSSGLYSYDGHHLTQVPNSWGSILAMAEGTDGTRWLGTRAGVVVGDRLYSYDKSDNHSVSSDKISDLCADRRGRMWIAAFGGGLDLAVATPDGSYTFRHFLNDNAQQREARTLCIDHQGRMWLGTGDGCYVFSPDELLKNNAAYQHLSTNSNSKTDEVHAICEDRHHRVWVAITGTGVACYDNNGTKPILKHCYTTSDGLGDIAVQSITEDRDGHIYIGTNRGLSVFDEKTQLFHDYLLGGTMLGNIYMENAASLLPDGRLAFGTKNGLMILSPKQLAASHENSLLAITDILVNGVPINEVSPQNDAVDHTQAITLAYDQNSLTFRFSDFSFDNTESSLYTYMLKGYDKDWQPLTNSSSATYRNLKSGHYTLLLRSCNSEGVWSNQTKELDIHIRPPFWATWYAYLFYILVITVVARTIYRQLRQTNELRNKIKVEQQLAEYKVQFFTGISHEFRTPLTIIQGAMERIRDAGNIPGNLKQPVGNMQKSVKRMARLINRLMDFRKIQENRMTLAVEDTDVVAFLRDIWTTFRDLAENKRINLQFNTFASSYKMPVDIRKVDSIAYNLVSNALKYTPIGGSVAMRLALDKDAHLFMLEVIDDGIGISEERQQQLFQRFQQSSTAHDSVGIGLNLSYQLALLHKGALTFRENPEGGSIFTLTLPADGSAYSKDDYASDLATAIVADSTQTEPWLENYKETAPPPLNDRTLLIVEDDDDVREYLVTELRNYFEVTEVTNGSEAWEQINEQRPDIILSDVAMPLMNGFELTQRIKKDKTLSDIPVVLLTAFSDDVKRERGFTVGADDYIQKPFSVRTLVARLSQLLEQRDKLRNAYAAAEVTTPVVAIVKDERDKKFLDTLEAWVYGHLSDTTLNVDELANSMGFGRSSFYRKVNALTGMTPNNYIRRIRMEESKKMLEETNLTISEVAYKTGFNNAFYFSKCFKGYYGMPPSRFRNGEATSTESGSTEPTP